MLGEQPKGEGRTIAFLPIDQAAGPAWLSPYTLPHGPGELNWPRLASYGLGSEMPSYWRFSARRPLILLMPHLLNFVGRDRPSHSSFVNSVVPWAGLPIHRGANRPLSPDKWFVRLILTRGLSAPIA